MKFFMPVGNTVDPEELYQGIRKFVNQHHRIDSESRIYSITFDHNGKTYTDTIGEKSDSNNEIVYAIFETQSVYLVCTPTRGVLGGGPMFAGKSSTKRVELFEPLNP